MRPAVEAEGQTTCGAWLSSPAGRWPTGGATAPKARAAVPGSFAHFIGLPGNPVSAYVTFLLFVRPSALRLQGIQAVEPQAVTLISGLTDQLLIAAASSCARRASA